MRVRMNVSINLFHFFLVSAAKILRKFFENLFDAFLMLF